MNIAQLLTIDAIIPHLQARDKKQVLKRLAEHASSVCTLSEKEIFSVLVERERIDCTGMGNGVCIPHGRYKSLDSIHIIFARLDKPIDFGAVDGKKVDLFFLLMSPSSADTEHLKALSIISKLLRDRKLCKTLRTTCDASKLHALLTSNHIIN